MVEVEGYEGDLILNLLRHATLVTPAAQHFWISLSARYAKQLHAARLQHTTTNSLVPRCSKPDSASNLTQECFTLQLEELTRN